MHHLIEVEGFRLHHLPATESQELARKPGGPLARLGSWLAPSASAKGLVLNSAALAPDGRTLYLLGEQGILVLDTATLTVRQRFAPEAAFSSIAVGADGAQIYVVSSQTGQVERRDAATGVVTNGYDIGSPLWGILRVEAQR